MREIKWQGIGFFVLLFLLAIGLSYLAFNENSKDKAQDETRMSIALVNEDAGTSFNDEQIVFGDDFAASVNKDDNHDWYVVSRGVAESGFERNAYDMMIVIPSDFSETSLSIHLDKPDPVALHYKINATGHDQVRAEAEKTAEKVLNDFNERLVDVYFASIIGNLQDAQDDIHEIIAKEADYTNEYQANIHSPLSNYTDRFETVQQYTDNSKKEYKGLEDVLSAFQDNIAEGADDSQSFTSDIDSVLELKDNQTVKASEFGKYLDQFVEQMHRPDVSQQLGKLERENASVYQQFQTDDADEETPFSFENKTLATQTNKLQRQMKDRSKEISKLDERLHKKINEDLTKVIADNLDDEFDDYIDDLFPKIDEQLRSKIEKQINELPTLSIKDLKDSKLTGATLERLKKITKTSEKYGDEFDFYPYPKNQDSLLSSKIKAIKKDLSKNGVIVKDKLPSIPEYENSVITLDVPEEYTLANWKINGVDYGQNEEVNLPETPSKMKIEAKFRLTDEYADIDVFSPVEWNWKITQEGKEEVETIPDDGDDTPPPEKPEEEKPDSDQDSEGGNSETSPEDGDENDANQETENQEKAPVDGEEDANQDSDVGEGSDDTEEEPEKDPDEEDSETISKTITKTNNYLYQKVQSPLVVDSTETLVAAASDMVNEYYKLQSLYEQYFGFTFDESENESQKIVDPKKDLVDQASEDSLYYLLHKENVKQLLAEELTKGLTADLQASFAGIQEKVTEYKDTIDRTSDKTAALVETMSDTRDHAGKLNSEVSDLIEEVNAWHEASLDLAKDNTVVLDDDQTMNTAVMDLATNFQPLLTSSESLKGQAESNFETADHVYQTFDMLDNEAENIQESGSNLVQHAGELADKLADKSLEDTEFAENFNGVLANSRVGDRQNEELYSFLANPVQTENDGIITKGKSFSPYFLVLILSMITLFSAYVLTNMEQKRRANLMASENSELMKMNLPISLLTLGFGCIEGLVIGLVSFYLLDLEQGSIYLWISMMVLLMMAMILIATYLLRQLKMIGMFLLLVMLSLYLLLTKSLGFHFENPSLMKGLRQMSPLQYIETLLTNVIEGKGFSVLLALLLLLIISGVGFVINLVVIHRGNGGESDEETAEAN